MEIGLAWLYYICHTSVNMAIRKTTVVSFRLDVRIVDQLDILAKKRPETRNFLVEQILAEKCGLPFYEWHEGDSDDAKDDE